MALTYPRTLLDAARRGGWEGWVGSLPETVRRLEAIWSVTVGLPFEPGGQTAWVAPARGPLGEQAVVKVMRRHWEGAHEADGLRLWNGDGAVMLLAVEETDDSSALLLERCVPGTSLSVRPEPEQDPVIADRLRRLWRTPPPGHALRPLQSMCDAWADQFEAKAALVTPALDAGLARQGLALFRQLPATAAGSAVLCTDLHAGNVLAAQREPWLVIDPKPYVGDPCYDLTQHLLNCQHRLHTDPRAMVRRVADLAGQDADRVLLWLFARCVVESPGRTELVGVATELAPR